MWVGCVLCMSVPLHTHTFFKDPRGLSFFLTCSAKMTLLLRLQSPTWSKWLWTSSLQAQTHPPSLCAGRFSTWWPTQEFKVWKGPNHVVFPLSPLCFIQTVNQDHASPIMVDIAKQKIRQLREDWWPLKGFLIPGMVAASNLPCWESTYHENESRGTVSAGQVSAASV